VTMRALIFDDDAAIGRLVVKIATMLGLEAKAVADAEAFRERLQDFRPQVVVLDLQLGNTDGVEQMRMLANRHYTGALVLMSGYDARVLATVRSVGESLGLKVEHVLEKPLRVADLEQLFERLRSAGEVLSPERLLKAIANDELTLHFQPVVIRTPRVVKKLEALVRWEHPSLGQISPDVFLPAVEKDVVIVDALTNWVLGATVKAYQTLRKVGLVIPLAMNTSTQNLHDLTLPDRFEQRLGAGGMPPQHLCLEITEGELLKDAARSMEILIRLRLKGIQLSIDDFGTGYSSLKLLLQMPFSEIKIDRSFVTNITTSRDSRTIVKCILDLAANMGMDCVAEGIETAETAELLEQMGIRNLQGFFIAKPMPIELITAWLLARN
jgi:EAL domain-containing protein (putative c-di-GMP-specific phosphodiesterase class I)